MAIIVFIIVMVKAVPAFTDTFAELGVELPAITKAMMALSDFMVHKWWVLALIALALVTARILLKRDPRGRAWMDKNKLTWSPFHKLHMMNAAAQFSSTMATMVTAGLPLVKALDVTANVKMGKGLAESMAQNPYFPKLLTEMTGVGEQSGNMEKTLTVVGDYFNNEVSLATERLLSVLEPCITIGLAIITVLLLLGVYLPMFTMYGSIV